MTLQLAGRSLNGLGCFYLVSVPFWPGFKMYCPSPTHLVQIFLKVIYFSGLGRDGPGFLPVSTHPFDMPSCKWTTCILWWKVVFLQNESKIFGPTFLLVTCYAQPSRDVKICIVEIILYYIFYFTNWKTNIV